MPYKQVTDNIFIGDIFSLVDSELFTHVKSVISLCKSSVYFLAENTEHYIYDIEDNRNVDIISVAKECYGHIEKCEQENKHILIHCQAGKSRSASVIIYYLMKKYDLSFNNAYGKLKKIKPDIGLNNGFYSQLKNCKF